MIIYDPCGEIICTLDDYLKEYSPQKRPINESYNALRRMIVSLSQSVELTEKEVKELKAQLSNESSSIKN